MKSDLRIAIVSDIHAFEGIEPDKAPSFCNINDNREFTNPMVGLKSLISAESLKCDLLLCPGDLAEKAQKSAITYAWDNLHKLSALLQATTLYTTTGNHDADSRHCEDFDAKGFLQSLTPRYPFECLTLSDQYWARHYVHIESDLYRIVVLNSSAYHGEGKLEKSHRYEFEYGRVSDVTLDALRKELSGCSERPINILLCHHHPHPHSELGLGKDDLMENGSELLHLLEKSTAGEWLVVHGHKHHPKLEYASGGTTPPIVFAAGSLSHVLYGTLRSNCTNQFYIFDFNLDEIVEHGLVGRFRSWDWIAGHGWKSSSRDGILPAEGGFGFRGNRNKLADRVRESLSNTPRRWQDLTLEFPMLNFLLPADLSLLVQRLAAFSDVIVQDSNTMPPTLLSRSK